MYRGTTPTLTFTLPFEVEQISKISLVFFQSHKLVFEKTKEDFTFEGNNLILKLTEKETLQFNASSNPVEMQFRVLVNGDVIASKIMKVEVKRILCEEVLSDDV